MTIVTGWHGGLTTAQAEEMEKELRADAEAEGVGIAFRRAEEPEGSVALGWFVLPPPRLAEAAEAGAPPGGLAAAIREAAARVGVEALALATFAALESGFDPAARSATSSARGLFGIIDATWEALVARHGPAHGVAASDRDDIRAQCLMAAELLRGVAAALGRGLGRRPALAELYCGHFLGSAAAAALLAADPAEPAIGVLARFYAETRLGPGFAARIRAANRPIFEAGGTARSAGEVLVLLRERVERILPRARALLAAAPPLPFPSPAPATRPEWLRVAEAEEAAGVAELPGRPSNPRIEEYFAWTTLGEQPDSTAWCGAFVSFCLGMAGEVGMGRGSARAANWLGWGRPLARPRPGCVVVLRPQAPGTSGHVGFWAGKRDGRITLLGGNQGNRVRRQDYAAAELRPGGFRWPA
jgi:uncharacterized protein (TIGR02594 family)